jgi:Tat protein translocase TatB subunit
MFLFILDSIGTSELILIGIIALMFLGPRKLPQIAKTIGKTLADFRNTTNEFKSTWQREVDFEEEIQAIRTVDLPDETPTTVPRVSNADENVNIDDLEEADVKTMAAPEIKPVQSDLFTDTIQESEPQTEAETTNVDDLSDKRNWL